MTKLTDEKLIPKGDKFSFISLLKPENAHIRLRGPISWGLRLVVCTNCKQTFYLDKEDYANGRRNGVICHNGGHWIKTKAVKGRV